MKYIKQFEYVIDNEHLKKLSSLGIPLLYHAIKSDRAIIALNDNKLGGYSFQRTWEGGKRLKDDNPKYEKSDYLRGISTSRDIEYCAKWNDVIFVFDREKIKNTYKILPYNWGFHIGNDYKQRSIKREKEEFIITGFNKNIKNDPRNLKFMKMLEKPNGYIEPLDKYLIGFFISDYVGEYLNDDIKTQLQSHPKYLGFYREERSKIKKLSLTDKIKNAFSKKYENYDDQPKVGDYVKLYGADFDNTLKDFLKDNIGQIVKINKELDFPYDVEFDEPVPVRYDSRIMAFEIDEIVDWSYDKESLEIKKDIKKYNL